MSTLVDTNLPTRLAQPFNSHDFQRYSGIVVISPDQIVAAP
jgi:hypothetical protein